MDFKLPERFGTLSPSDMAGLSGLAQLQGIADGSLPAPPISKAFNFGLSEVAEGRAVFMGNPKAEFLNPLGIIHGGWAATILDSALGCAVHVTLTAGEGYTTLEFKVNCVRAITPNTGTMTCVGTIVHRGRTTATSAAELRDADGKLYAHGTETCLIFPARKS